MKMKKLRRRLLSFKMSHKARDPYEKHGGDFKTEDELEEELEEEGMSLEEAEAEHFQDEE